MHFTRTRDEIYIGMEFCCDTCNKRAGQHHHRWIGNHWWYVRYNAKDEHPSLWICKECKESME